MKVTIFDYGAGNLHSLVKAIAAVGPEPRVETDPERAIETDVLVLPGVGAFTPAAQRLGQGRRVMRESLLDGLPCLGICLGMQLFFESSEEGPGQGLGVIPGRVSRLRARRLPQIGWSLVEEVTDPIVRNARLEYGYYANSFACRPASDEVVTAWSIYDGDRFPSVIRFRRCLGTQFHPEKSSDPGLALIENFLAEARG